MTTKPNQIEINNFIQSLRSQFSTPEAFLEICQKTEPEAEKLDASLLEKLIIKFQPYLEKMPPAHDLGHFRRDLLSALALSGDPFVNKMFKSDLWAGILSGAFHDIGNSIHTRHAENQNLIAHAEIGAWLFYRKSEGLISEDLRRMTTYSIAAHTHYLKPVEIVGKNINRDPYFFGIWQKDEKFYGVATTYARICDRLDGMGGVTEAAREFAMVGDLVLDQGISFDGQNFEKRDPQKLLSAVFDPDTVFNWLQKLRATSEFPSPYSQYDKYFSTLPEMKALRFLENDHLVSTVTNSPIATNLTKDDLYKFLKKVSQSPKFDSIWQILSPAWDKLDKDLQARWYSGLQVMKHDYANRLNSYDKYLQNSPISGASALAKTIIISLRKDGSI